MLRKTVKRILASRAFASIARRSSIREIYFFVSPRFTPQVVAETGQLRYLVRTSDLSVSRELFIRGGFDEQVLPQLLRLLEQFGYDSIRSKAFVDIGANIGTSVISAARLFGFSRGIAFEPEPTNFKLIKINALLNDVADRIAVHQLALSDHPGSLTFEIAPENSGDNRVRIAHGMGANTEELLKESDRPTMQVEGTTIDALVERGILRLDDIGLVWMDTQGHEGHVLSGARTLLARDVPILFEYWPYALARAGGLEKLESIITEHYTHFVDVRDQKEGQTPVPTPVDQLPSLRAKYQGTDLTDLLLVKRLNVDAPGQGGSGSPAVANA